MKDITETIARLRVRAEPGVNGVDPDLRDVLAHLDAVTAERDAYENVANENISAAQTLQAERDAYKARTDKAEEERELWRNAHIRGENSARALLKRAEADEARVKELERDK